MDTLEANWAQCAEFGECHAIKLSDIRYV